jgi:tetratricopeptide (TPR) repeat protein
VSDQKDPRLEELFAQLHKITDSIEALQVEQGIWRLWSRSGSETVDLLLGRGTDAMQAGSYKPARALFNAVIELAPDFAEGWNKRATLYYMMGKYEASKPNIDRTLELEPRHFGALSGLGLVNIHLERWEAALEAFQRAFKVNPTMTGPEANAKAIELKLCGKAI